jgi:hypothetical protein
VYVQAISAHFLWLSFLQEQWAIISRMRDARTAAARVTYGRLLAASLHDPAVLSHHPAAVGAYFRLLTLGLKYGRSCVKGGPATAGKDVLLLFDRIVQAVSVCVRTGSVAIAARSYWVLAIERETRTDVRPCLTAAFNTLLARRCLHRFVYLSFLTLQALLWFKSPPRYFARCTRRAAAEQVAAVNTFMQELNKTLNTGIGSTSRSAELTWPSYRSPAAAAAGHAAGLCSIAAPVQ